MRILKLLIFLVFLYSPGQITATEQHQLPVFAVTYNLYYSGLEIGEIKRTVKQLDSGEYQYESTSKSAGVAALFYDDLINEKSIWNYQAGKFIPVRYSYVRNRKEKKREINIDFNWDKKISYNQINNQQLQLELEDGFLDKLLYQYVIMVDLKNGNLPGEYTVIDARKVKTYEFELQGKEIVNLPMGKFPAVKINMNPKGEKSTLSFWCSDQYGFLPVKIVSIDDDGKQITAVLNSVQSFVN